MQARQSLADIQFLLTEVLQAPAQWQALAPFAETDAELAAQVLEEAAKFLDVGKHSTNAAERTAAQRWCALALLATLPATPRRDALAQTTRDLVAAVAEHADQPELPYWVADDYLR
eukprot:gene13112-12892_t